MDDKREKLLLVSSLAFYPMHWEAFRELCTSYQVSGCVIAAPPPFIPNVHRQLGWVDAESARRESFRPRIETLPQTNPAGRAAWLRDKLAELRPDAIWVQEEPNSELLFDILRIYRDDLWPRIVTAACENIFTRSIRWWRRGNVARLWSRLNGVVATANASLEGLRRVGLPNAVPTMTLVAGCHSPPKEITPLELPLIRGAGDFMVGFAGRIDDSKGWRPLLDALANLPPNFKLAMAGDGPDEAALRKRIAHPSLAGRVIHLGILPKEQLWRFYKAIDCLVLPSLTRRKWKEQFGGVLADAMAVGLPIIGSDSGSIPEVIGPAGLITPEGDSAAIAVAIRRLNGDPALRRRFSQAGPRRFRDEFSIDAYARKLGTALGLEPLSVADAQIEPKHQAAA